MQKYPLDKVLSAGVSYRAEEDKAYVITQIGTDSSTKAVLKVAGAPVGEFVTDFAPLVKSGSNAAGPYPLGPCFVVVPQDKVFSFEGASGSKLRIKGTILELEAGEALPLSLIHI